jgi:hypothetical protein
MVSRTHLRVPDANGGILPSGDDCPVPRSPHSPVNPPGDTRDHECGLIRLCKTATDTSNKTHIAVDMQRLPTGYYGGE